jgi:hypothetical protein
MSSHAGCPSAVMNDATRRPLERLTSISQSLPNTWRSVTRADTSFWNIPGQRRSVLQLPPRIERLRSIRQLHSIIRESSPSGCAREPSRRVRPRSFPNSTKRADPYPRQTWDTLRPTSASPNVASRSDELRLASAGSPVVRTTDLASVARARRRNLSLRAPAPAGAKHEWLRRVQRWARRGRGTLTTASQS